MVPFWYDYLTSISCKRLELIGKPSLISDSKTLNDLMQIDLSDSMSLGKSLMSKSDFLHQEIQCLRKFDKITLNSVKVFKNRCKLYV